MARKPWTQSAQYKTNHAYLAGEHIHALANSFHKSVMFMRQAGSSKEIDAATALFGFREQ